MSYRIISTLIIWVLSTEVIIEMLLGGKFGIGVRLLQFQQLYKVAQLYSYLILILILSYMLEKVCIAAFCRIKFDWKKISSVLLISTLLVVSILYWFSQSSPSKQKTITTYSLVANLPIYVYIEKFNTLDLKLVQVGSGLQAMDNLQGDQTIAAGFVDMPNALSGIATNLDLKVVSQAVEVKDHPSLFLVSKKAQDKQNLNQLEGSKVGYFPNNSLIKSGLDFSLFRNSVNTAGIEYTSTSDPLSLVQGFQSGAIDSFLGPEPFVSDIEEQNNLTRVNPNNSLIEGINFSSLPLAALVIDTKELSQDEQKKFVDGIISSINYIKENQDSKSKAKQNLQLIMQKYGLNQNSSLSLYQSRDEIDLSQTENLLNLIKQFDSQPPKTTLPTKDYYLNNTF
ncbi:ABC transporter substrate-binding protein [Candidatus Gracilibacteria bacterium]|nr:ABC transporter substrate-binding protein [Candidatus Gracilibacteria bacterium]